MGLAILERDLFGVWLCSGHAVSIHRAIYTPGCAPAMLPDCLDTLPGPQGHGEVALEEHRVNTQHLPGTEVQI